MVCEHVHGIMLQHVWLCAGPAGPALTFTSSAVYSGRHVAMAGYPKVADEELARFPAGKRFSHGTVPSTSEGVVLISVHDAGLALADYTGCAQSIQHLHTFGCKTCLLVTR